MSSPLPLPPSRREQLGMASDAERIAELTDQRDRAEAMACSLKEENALLLRQRDEFRERCIKAQDVLTEIARGCRGDSQRVEGKAQGLGLAVSYLDEYVSGRLA